MKQFSKILKFELGGYLTNKVFVGITLFMIAAIVIVMFFPRIMNAIDEGNETEMPGDLPTMEIVSDKTELLEIMKDTFSAAFSDYNIVVTNESHEKIKEKITSGEIDCAIYLKSLTEYTYYVDDVTLYDETTYIADSVLKNVYQASVMMSSGMTVQDVQQVLSVEITHDVEKLGKDQMENFFYTYIMIFALYMVILLYGQMVATNVATEKSSRAMELLITSANPTSMMFGKVFSSCIAGLIQIISIFGTAILCFNFNKEFWGGNQIIASIFDMPPELLVYMIIFFILGFFIYAFMYGAIGSTASKLEDINTSVMPITMLFIVGFFIVMFSMSSGNVDTMLMKISSFVPFTSPMAMFTRIAMSNVPFYEIAISIGLLIVSVIGVGIVAAKIYRVGVLLYGTTPKIGDIIKAIRKS